MLNNAGNCPYLDNAYQTDTDGDGAGDTCDGCPMILNLLCGCVVPG